MSKLALAITERLTANEPQRADYQWDAYTLEEDGHCSKHAGPPGKDPGRQ